MRKEEHIRERLLELTYNWFSIVLLLGMFLFLILGAMDYLVAPENFKYFLTLRLTIAVTLLFFLVLVRTLRRRNAPPVLLNSTIVVVAAFCAITIEIMVLKLGGGESFYYAGLNLLVICIVGLVPLSLRVSAMSAGAIYMVYVLPILVLGEINNLPVFISNNFFFLSTIIIVMVWRAMGQRNLENVMGLQFELDKDKQRLSEYSGGLEVIVEERTRELFRSEQMLGAMFEQANDGIVIMDEGGVIQDVNRRACELHGYQRDEMVGSNIEGLEAEEGKSRFTERFGRILDGESLLFTTRHRRKDGSLMPLEVSARAVDVGGRVLVQSFHRDVTEKEKLQRQLLHSQKMDSVGALAGGMAHDFNNVLAAILGLADLVLLKGRVDEYAASRVRLIEKAVRQGTQMVSKLMSFARRSNFEVLPFNLNSVVEDTLGMLARLLPRRIVLQRRYCSPPPVVLGDVSQIEQVVMNLAVNAKYAMPEGGELTVATEAVHVVHKDVDSGLDLVPGRYARLTVSDTGVGITEDRIPHIFEPFYTTRDKGKGTGLGLAMVYGIVKEHGGDITVSSTPGKGTAFSVYLPVSDKRIAEAEISNNAVDLKFEGTVLVVDDEAAVLDVVAEVLDRTGMSVVKAANPLVGLDIFRQDPGAFDLLITDIVMPQMYGTKLIDEARRLSPGIRIIAITGFSESAKDLAADVVLMKPFGASKLLAAVKEVLGL